MTDYLKKSFSVGMASDQEYRDNHDRIFGKREHPTAQAVDDALDNACKISASSAECCAYGNYGCITDHKRR